MLRYARPHSASAVLARGGIARGRGRILSDPGRPLTQGFVIRLRRHPRPGRPARHTPSASPAGRPRSAGLSVRMRAMRGKRSATPDLCRVESCAASKATSSTSAFSTSRTGPKRPMVWLRIHLSSQRELLIGEAEIGLADRHQLLAPSPSAPQAEGVVGIEAAALAVAALGVHQHRVDRQRVALPLPPQPLRPPGDIGAVGALQHQPLDRGGARAVRAPRTVRRRTAKAISGDRSIRAGAMRARPTPPAGRGARRRAAGADPRVASNSRS